MINIFEKNMSDELPKDMLLLIQSPTGSGKSHAIAEVIAKKITTAKEDDGIVWIYLINDKKNRDAEFYKIKQKVKGNTDELLLLKSIPDQVVSYFDKKSKGQTNKYQYLMETLYDTVPENFERTRKCLKGGIECYCTLRKAWGKSEQFKEQIESNSDLFRKIKTAVKSDFAIFVRNQKLSVSEKEAILFDTIPWIPEMFPEMQIASKKLIVMTAQRFAWDWHPIIGNEKSFVELFNNKTVNCIIDESDSVKKTWLTQIIDSLAPKDNKNSQREDIFLLSKRIFDSLNPKNLAVPTFMLNAGNNAKILSNLYHIYKKLDKKYFLHFNLKIDATVGEDISQFLFNIGETNRLISDKSRKSYLIYQIKRKEKEVVILSDEEVYKKHPKYRLDRMLIELQNKLEKFLIDCERVANNFHNFKINLEKDKNNLLVLSLDEELRYVIRTILRTADIESNRLPDYLIKHFVSKKLDKKIKLFTSDNSIYNRGFAYTQIFDNPVLEYASHAYLYSQKLTPEKMLVNMANNWRVFLISATSDNPSVLSNFDLNWVKENVNNYIELCEEDRKILRERNNIRSKKFKQKVKVNVKQINVADEKLEYSQILQDALPKKLKYSDLVELFRKYPDQISPGDIFDTEGEDGSYSFEFARRVKVLKAIISMVETYQNDHLMQAFILYRNSTTSVAELSWYKECLKKIDLDDYGDKLITVTAKNFDSRVAQVKKAWSEGELRILLTTYSSLERGTNLQYRVSEKYTLDNYVLMNPQFINKDYPEKDLDGIYLENPTHLFTSIVRKGMFDPNTALHIIYEQFALYESGEPNFTLRTANNNIATYFGNHGTRFVMKDLLATKVAATVQIEQALGRIYRTQIKNKMELVILDSEIIGNLDVNYLLSKPTTGLVEGIIEQINIKSNGLKELHLDQKRQQKLRRVSHKMRYLKEWAHNLRKLPQNKQTLWVKVRKFIAAHPYLNSLEDIPEDLREEVEDFYWEFSEPRSYYYYKSDRDFERLDDVSLSRTSLVKRKLDFSEYGQMLNKIFNKNQWLKQELINRRFCLDLATKHKFLLTPGGFNNLYKAAISEEIFGLVCDRQNITYHEMSDLNYNEFELYDGYFESNNNQQIVYYDVKNYDSRKPGAKRELLESKEKNKLKRSAGQAVIMINFYDWEQKNYQPIRLNDELNGIYTYLALFEHDGTVRVSLINDLTRYFGG